ncbi:MAG TPA: dihydrofolate reductase family protein [Thermoanaerobaculia bacterium]
MDDGEDREYSRQPRPEDLIKICAALRIERAKRFNEIKKYVVSRSGDVDTSWKGTVLLRDIDGVKRLKEEDGPNLVTQGSTELLHALFSNDLVDEIKTFTVPVVLGGGKKLFADRSAPHGYKLTGSRVSGSGLVIAHYERSGDVLIGEAPPATKRNG